MVEEAKRTLAHLCPACRQSVAVERSIFQLAVPASELPCLYGKSSLRVGLMGDRVKFIVPCLFHGKDHTVTCSSHAFLREKVLASSCAASGLDCCHVEEERPMFAALRCLEKAVDKLEAVSREEGTSSDELVIWEVLPKLKETAQRDGIPCTCGSHRWKLQVNLSFIDLFCADYGGAIRTSAATANDIDDICCKNKLVIHGQD